MKRTITFAVLLVVVSTAGCLAVSAPGDTETDGVAITEETVTNKSTLIGAHTETLRDTSFTTIETTRVVGEDYQLELSRTWQLDTTSSVRGLMSQNLSVSGDPPDRFVNIREFIAYRDGETAYRRVHSGQGPDYRAVDLLDTQVTVNPAMKRPTLSQLRLDNTTAETATRDGEQFYRIDAELPDTEIATNRSAELLVTTEGVVEVIEIRQQRQGPQGQFTVIMRAEITNIGETTVEQPDWYETAVEETDEE